MHSDLLLQRLLYSISFGGKCAFIFAPVLSVFLFTTMLMVGGDGRAPGVTHFSASIVALPGKLLGMPSHHVSVSPVLFWSLVVFGVSFLYALVNSAGKIAKDGDRSWCWPIIVVVFVIWAMIGLIQGVRSQTAFVNEKELVLEFVRTNSEVLQMVGGKPKTDIVVYKRGRGRTISYEIGVEGNITLYAIVEVSGTTMAPTFKLMCMTPIRIGQRDSFKHPCEQNCQSNQ